MVEVNRNFRSSKSTVRIRVSLHLALSTFTQLMFSFFGFRKQDIYRSSRRETVKSKSADVGLNSQLTP